MLFQRWFSLKELITTEAFWNSSHHFRRNDFFIAGTLQKNMFFVIPIPFRTYTKHFRRFLDSFWSSAEQRWFRENQRWTALKQRWLALVFLTHSETALISAEIYKISETVLFSADLLWDFNPGSPRYWWGWNQKSIMGSETHCFYWKWQRDSSDEILAKYSAEFFSEIVSRHIIFPHRQNLHCWTNWPGVVLNTCGIIIHVLGEQLGM